MKRIFVLSMLLLGLANSAHAACTVHRWTLRWGVETNAYMQTDGSICRSTLTWTTGTSEVHSMSIAAAPRNGTASASRPTVTYRPRAGFKGEDTFVFAIVGRQAGQPVRATVRVSVKVQ